MDAPAHFRQQLLACIPRLRRYARSRVFDAAQADDLVQTALERALLHWRQYDPARDLLVWVLAIAHHAHLDTLRREGRTVVTDPQALADEQDRAGGDPGHDVGLRLDLLAALARLAPEAREALLLVAVEQLSYAEAAQVMGTPVGTVMSRVCRARVALRGFLEQPAAASPGPRRAPPGGPGLRRVV